MPKRIDLVADVGESFGDYRMGADDELLPTLTSANIACGFHAGDPRTMDAAVKACVSLSVSIGAHPGFPDLVGFGRRSMDLTRDEIRTDVLYQMGALDAFVRAHGGRLAHLAPHGRLGNLAVTDKHFASGVADAAEQYGADLVVLTQAGALEKDAASRGLRVGILGLIDRAYEKDGTLVSRRLPGAVLHDPQEIADRAALMVIDQEVISHDGHRISIQCDSLLLHGDNGAALEAAKLVRSTLQAEGVLIEAFTGASASAT